MPRLTPSLPKNIDITFDILPGRGPCATYNGVTIQMTPYVEDDEVTCSFSVGNIFISVFYIFNELSTELSGWIELFDYKKQTRVDNDYFLTLTDNQNNRVWRNWE